MIVRTDSSHPDFKLLVHELDAYLAKCDGDEHAYYHQFNGLENLRNVVIAYFEGKAVGCGAFKPFDAENVEVKRMYVEPANRKCGVAAKILMALEQWALELGFKSMVLETGVRQTEAMQFYPKQGYARIDNYGPYLGMENSRCFKKKIAL